MIHQHVFDQTIGQLDRVLSVLVNWGRSVKKNGYDEIDEPNAQTLKHHAEDMIAAGQKILKDLGHEVEGTPQPEKEVLPKCTTCGRTTIRNPKFGCNESSLQYLCVNAMCGID